MASDRREYFRRYHRERRRNPEILAHQRVYARAYRRECYADPIHHEEIKRRARELYRLKKGPDNG